MENVKSDSGRLADSFWIVAGGFANLFAVVGLCASAGITIPFPASSVLCLAEMIAIGGGALFVEVVIFACVHSLFVRMMSRAEFLIAAATDGAERRMTQAAEAGAALVRKCLEFAGVLVRIPFRRLWAAYVAPWLERRRQREELRRAFEQMQNPKGSFEDFVRDFEAGGSNASEEDAGKNGKAAPSSDPFTAACRTLGLPEAGGFGQAELKARYQALMKAVHPDIIGANVFAAQVNEARGIIKARKGWK
jgi:hypothetical protein